jgi:lipid-A-disaccharide synthase
MQDAGLDVITGVDELSAMGFLEVVRSVPRHAALLRRLVQRARAGRYRFAILIDYPGFHLRLGEALRKAGVPVLVYIAPQLWAWRPGRLARLRRAADRIGVILPFEADWFGTRGVAARFVGHPLLDQPRVLRPQALDALGLTTESRVLGIFPGSRNREIQRHWPLFREVAKRMLVEGRCTTAIVAGTSDGEYPGAGSIRVVRGQAEQVLAVSAAALIKSGTSTLEAALAGTPMVVVYRSSRATYEIARRLMTVGRISLVNLVAGQDVVPEFWHLPISAREMGDALAPLLDVSSPEHRAQLGGLAVVSQRLGTPGAARRVVELTEELALR